MRRWLALVVLVAGCGTATTTGRRASTPVPEPSTITAARRAKPPSPPGHRSALPSPGNGSLPQTDQRPSASTQTFKSEMAALWRGVRTDSVHAAMPAFFPQAAYVQVKAIADPQSDWENRLVGSFALDVGAAHRLVGASAQLIEVAVPAGLIHWVSPGACYNRLGYWEVPNSRVVYRSGGQIRSFGIASMISWRGIWYVVHLGSVSGGAGVVDGPQAGKGSPAASSTC